MISFKINPLGKSIVAIVIALVGAFFFIGWLMYLFFINCWFG